MGRWIHEKNEDALNANLLAEEYTVQMHGMPSDTTSRQFQAHVEGALQEWLRRSIFRAESKLSKAAVAEAAAVAAAAEAAAAAPAECRPAHGKPPVERAMSARAKSRWQGRLEKLMKLRADEFWKVWDVCLIVNYGQLLRDALTQAPLEKKAVLVDRKLRQVESLREERNDGWKMSQHIAELKCELRETAEKLLSVRGRIESRGFGQCMQVCGAFVTFEHQVAARVSADLFRGGFTWLRQNRYLRYPVRGPPEETVSALERSTTFYARGEKGDAMAAQAQAGEANYGYQKKRQSDTKGEHTTEGATAPAPDTQEERPFDAKEPQIESESAPEGQATSASAGDEVVEMGTPPASPPASVPPSPAEGDGEGGSPSNDGGRRARLRALPAPHPVDVLHENLPCRVGSLPACRSWNTLARRILSRGIMVGALLCSVVAIIVVNTYKNSQVVAAATDAAEATETNVNVATGQLISNAASFVVVVVNVLLEYLAGFIGIFERHETVSGTRKTKVNVLTVAQWINLGFVNLVVSASAPKNVLTNIENDGWMCWRVPEGGSKEFCCLIGPTGLLLRGSYLTMDAGWHKEVGAAMLYTFLLQCIATSVSPLLPAFKLYCARRSWRSQLTLVEMENTWTGPEWDGPRFIGKAFAFFAVVVSYGAALPLVYSVGVAYFGVTWIVNRWAVLRLHRTPPVLSCVLLSDTMWWAEIALFWHAGFGFWSYASLPTYPLGSGSWAAPFSNYSDTTAAILSASNLTASLLADDGYDITGHVNSPGTLFLFLTTLLILAKSLIDIALGLLSSVLPVPSSLSSALREVNVMRRYAGRGPMRDS